jgi:hypothetical protein
LPWYGYLGIVLGWLLATFFLAVLIGIGIGRMKR